MQFSVQKSRCAKITAASLSVGLWLACGDDTSSKESASTSDAGERSPDAGGAGSSRTPKAGTGGSSTVPASGGKGGEVSAAVAGGAGAKSDKADTDKDKDSASQAPVSNTSKPGNGEAGHEDAGVGDEPAPTKTLKVSVRFKAKVGKDDFACGHKYSGQGTTNTTVTPVDLRMFVHDLSLISADGNKVPVTLNPRAPWQSEKLALLDFEDKTGRCTEGNAELNTAITGTAPAGKYKGIRFITGLPEDLNHADPTTAGEPLTSAAGLRWDGSNGFRFAKIELVQLGAAGDAPGTGLLHLGSTECAANMTCAKANRNAIELSTFDVANNSVVIDVAALFSRLDLTKTQACHSTEATCESMFQALGLELSTGKPRDGQKVFRVE